MPRPSSLIALASGRLTPLNRVALTLGLGLFLATILLVRPVHHPAPRLVLQPSSVLALDRNSPLLDKAFLQEGAALFMSAAQPDARGIDAAQPDASPFQAFGPEFRQEPNKSLVLSSDNTEAQARWPELDAYFPLTEDRPLATIGQKTSRILPKARVLQVQVFSESNEFSFTRDFPFSDPLVKNHKALLNSRLSVISVSEFRLGIDNFGLESAPYLLRSSGDKEIDRITGEWVGGLPWLLWLKPGSYRVVIGP